MLNEVSAKINKKMMLEESYNDFMMVIQEDAPNAILDEDAFGIQNNIGNGDELSMFEEDFFMEATEYDPELTTSLQDETDACDDSQLEDPSDFNSDTDLFKEVDYNDDYSAEYVNDTDVSTLLNKEVDYHDTYKKDADVSQFVVDESAELLAETDDEEEKEAPFMEDFFAEGGVGMHGQFPGAPNGPAEHYHMMEETEEFDDLEEDFFMESDDEDFDTDDDNEEVVSEDFFMEDFFAESEDDVLEEDFFEECGNSNNEEDDVLEEDFFAESDDDVLEEDFFAESDDDVLEEDFFAECGGVGTHGQFPSGGEDGFASLNPSLEDPDLEIDSYFAMDDMGDTEY